MLRKIAKIIKRRKKPDRLKCLVGLHGKRYKPTYWRYIWWLIRQEFITPIKLKILNRLNSIYRFCTCKNYLWCCKCGNINDYKMRFAPGWQYANTSFGKLKLVTKEHTTHFIVDNNNLIRNNYVCKSCKHEEIKK